ncbi:hypothetical protein [Streptomyces sp. NPDC018833]|uniref:hypothetical protein n=1 Tax=Streptomyces sp. NPDC018833 TaxID=3365053 RepID=UPI003793EC6E
MQPESANGTGGPGLAVPMAWLCAEYTAEEMLRAGALVEYGSLEYRAGRRTLALTIHLSDGPGAPDALRSAARIDEWLSLTSYGHPWQEWVEERLAARAAGERHGASDPDLALATTTWDWLRATELLAADLGDLEPWHPALPLDGTVDEADKVWTPAWQLGLPLGHLAIHLW